MIFAESENVELKSEVVSDICREIIAFANTKGGKLYIGVADDGSVSGVEDIDDTMCKVSNKIRDSIKPDVTMFVNYKRIKIDGKHILEVTVQKGTGRPYYLASKGLKSSGVFVRNGTSTDPATDTYIRKMIKETDGDSYEDMRSLEQSLSFETASRQFNSSGILFDSSKMQTLGFVSAAGIYSNVAMLLSDQCGCMVKAATFSGTDKNLFRDRREFSGSLFDQMEELYSYLDIRNNTKAAFEGLYRTDIRDYPEEALREALLNCIVHRDYSISASTLVSIFDDRMEFVSPGGLPSGVDLDDIMLGLSVCRNPKLAAIFYRLKLIEAYGTGLPKIMNSYKNYSVKPKIEVTGNAFRITLPNRNVCIAAQDTPPSASDYESYIMKSIGLNGHIVRGDIESLLGVSQATSNRILRQMIAKNMICKEGNGKRTIYRKKQI